MNTVFRLPHRMVHRGYFHRIWQWLRCPAVGWACLLAVPTIHAQQAGSVDPTFGESLGLAMMVEQIVIQPDGKVLIVGGTKYLLLRLDNDGSLDTTFVPGADVSSHVDTMIVQPDGKILVGGNFTTVNGVARNGLARLNGDGSLDTTFDPGPAANGFVNPKAVQSDGKIIVGYFTTIDGISTPNGIARLNADGSLDAGFHADTGTGNSIATVALQPDGRIIIGGIFTINGVLRNGIGRLNADGSLDSGFDPGAASVNPLVLDAVQPDGKIIASDSTDANGVQNVGIERLNADGSVDTGFHYGAAPEIDNALEAVVQPDGKIIVYAEFGNNVTRLNADGSLDTGFNPGTGAYNIIAAAVGSDDKVIVGGGFDTFDGVASNGIARLNADGSLDSTFEADVAPGPNLPVKHVLLQPDGKVIIQGSFLTVNGLAHNGIARLNADGSLDTGFTVGTNPGDVVDAALVQPDGKLIVLEEIDIGYGLPRRATLLRLNTDGSMDTSFNVEPGVADVPVAVQPDGKILLLDGGISRLNADGSVDTGFGLNLGSGPDDDVNAVALQPDGEILLTGDFGSFNGVARNGIARLHADGTLDLGFNPGASPLDDSNAVAVQADGKILLAAGNIARLNVDGSVDPSFVIGAVTGNGGHARIDVLTVQPDGKIIVIGNFSNINGVPRNGFARLNTDGNVDTGFDPASEINGNPDPSYTDGPFGGVAVQPDGRIIVGGDFTLVDGAVRNYVARLNTDGSVDPNFAPGEGVASIAALALQPDDGRVVVGGSFSDVNGRLINALARLNTDGSLDATFVPGLPSGDTVDAVALQPDDGNVLAADEPASAAATVVSSGRAGVPPQTQKVIHNPIIRCRKLTGTIDLTFNAATDGTTLAIVGLTGGQALIGGNFLNVNGTARSCLARLDADGSLDASFVGVAGATVRALSVLSANGSIIVGGDFASMDGAPRSHVARLNADGSLDASFDPGAGPNGTVNAVRALTGGPVLIGGSFTSVDGVTRNGLARLNADGSLDTGYNPGAAAATMARARVPGTRGAAAVVAAPVVVKSLDTFIDGRVVIGGLFNTVGGVTRPNVARLNADGSVDTTFDPGTGTNAAVNALQLQPDGRTLLGGGFSSVGGLKRRGAARLLGDNDLPGNPVPPSPPTPMVSVAAKGDATAHEGGGAGKFVISRDGTDLLGDLTVFFKLKGTAKDGVDYKETDDSVVIPAGAASVKVKVKPIDNTLMDGKRTVKLKLKASPSGSYNLGTAAKATISILDDD